MSTYTHSVSKLYFVFTWFVYVLKVWFCVCFTALLLNALKYILNYSIKKKNKCVYCSEDPFQWYFMCLKLSSLDTIQCQMLLCQIASRGPPKLTINNTYSLQGFSACWNLIWGCFFVKQWNWHFFPAVLIYLKTISRQKEAILPRNHIPLFHPLSFPQKNECNHV